MTMSLRSTFIFTVIGSVSPETNFTDPVRCILNRSVGSNWSSISVYYDTPKPQLVFEMMNGNTSDVQYGKNYGRKRVMPEIQSNIVSFHISGVTYKDALYNYRCEVIIGKGYITDSHAWLIYFGRHLN